MKKLDFLYKKLIFLNKNSIKILKDETFVEVLT